MFTHPRVRSCLPHLDQPLRFLDEVKELLPDFSVQKLLLGVESRPCFHVEFLILQYYRIEKCIAEISKLPKLSGLGSLHPLKHGRELCPLLK